VATQVTTSTPYVAYFAISQKGGSKLVDCGLLDSWRCVSCSHLLASSCILLFLLELMKYTFSGCQQRQLVKRQINQSSEYHLCPRHQGTDWQSDVRLNPDIPAGPVNGGETNGLGRPTCSAWSCFSFIYMLVKGSGLAQYEATISVKLILVYVYFSCFLYSAVHVSHVPKLSYWKPCDDTWQCYGLALLTSRVDRYSVPTWKARWSCKEKCNIHIKLLVFTVTQNS